MTTGRINQVATRFTVALGRPAAAAAGKPPVVQATPNADQDTAGMAGR
jgi:hypothetical protein